MKQDKKKKKRKKSVWLKAWHDPLAGLQAYSKYVLCALSELKSKCVLIYSSSNAIFFHMHSCLRFADLDADGDYHLLCGTLEKSLKIYRGVLTRA